MREQQSAIQTAGYSEPCSECVRAVEMGASRARQTAPQTEQPLAVSTEQQLVVQTELKLVDHTAGYLVSNWESHWDM